MSLFEPSSCDPYFAAPWGGNPWFSPDSRDGRMPREWNPNQLELELVQFFPLTEQITLDLDVEGCDTKPKITYLYGTVNQGTTWSTVATNIAPNFTITPDDCVGELSIGVLHLGLEKKPSWLQRKLHKLLGFNWRDK